MSVERHDAVCKICQSWATMNLEQFREVMAEGCEDRTRPSTVTATSAPTPCTCS